METEKLYNPIYVKADPEYFPGFGKKELNRSLYMGIFLIIFAIILWLILSDLGVVVLTVIIGITGIIIINTKNEANLSIVTYLCLVFYYLKEQQRYMYKYQDEWKK